MSDPQNQPGILTYANPPRPRQSAWSLIGLGLALLSLVLPAFEAWQIWQARRSGAFSISVGANPGYYAAPATAIVTSALGLRKGRKLLPVTVVVLSLVAIGATLFLGSRTW